MAATFANTEAVELLGLTYLDAIGGGMGSWPSTWRYWNSTEGSDENKVVLAYLKPQPDWTRPDPGVLALAVYDRITNSRFYWESIYGSGECSPLVIVLDDTHIAVWAETGDGEFEKSVFVFRIDGGISMLSMLDCEGCHYYGVISSEYLMAFNHWEKRIDIWRVNLDAEGDGMFTPIRPYKYSDDMLAKIADRYAPNETHEAPSGELTDPHTFEWSLGYEDDDVKYVLVCCAWCGEWVPSALNDDGQCQLCVRMLSRRNVVKMQMTRLVPYDIAHTIANLCVGWNEHAKTKFNLFLH